MHAAYPPPSSHYLQHHLGEPLLNHDRCDRRGKGNMPPVRQLTHAQSAHARRPARALRASRALQREGAGAAGTTTPIAAFSHTPCRPRTNVRRQLAINPGACQSRQPSAGGAHTVELGKDAVQHGNKFRKYQVSWQPLYFDLLMSVHSTRSNL
jgi:hypothetical protein